MSKVLCERMKGRQLNTSFGQFHFDQQGMAEVPDEHVNKLLTLNGYKLVVGGKPAPDDGDDEKEDASGAQNDAESGQVDKTSDDEENTQNDDENDAEQAGDDEGEDNPEDEEQQDDDSEEQPEKGGKPAMSVEYLNSKNVAQLKKIAKDNGVDLAGATKKDEIIPIILGAVNQ